MVPLIFSGVETTPKLAIIKVYGHGKSLAVKSLCILRMQRNNLAVKKRQNSFFMCIQKITSSHLETRQDWQGHFHNTLRRIELQAEAKDLSQMNHKALE